MRRSIRSGDKIKITDVKSHKEPYDIGDVLTVERVDFFGDVKSTKEKGNYPIERREFEIEELFNLTKGDKVRIVSSYSSDEPYEVGDILTVAEVANHGPGIGETEEHGEWYIAATEYEIVTEEEVNKKTVAKEGDLIRIVTDYSHEPYKEGDILFVVKVDEDGDVEETLEHGTHYILQEEFEVIEVSPDVLEKIREYVLEKIRELNDVKVMNESRLSVGDYISYNPESGGRYLLSNGVVEGLELGRVIRLEVNEEGTLIEFEVLLHENKEYEGFTYSSRSWHVQKVRLDNAEQLIKEKESNGLEEGDYVILNPEYIRRKDYKITNEDMLLGKLTGDSTFLQGRINIEVVSHKFAEHEGKDYDVEARFFQKADEDTIRKHSNGNPIHMFKEGDYAKVVTDIGVSSGGDVVKVTDVCLDKIFPIEAFNERTKTATMFLKEHLRKIEITEQALSFIREGREVGEAKEGDIVRWPNSGLAQVKSDDYSELITLVCPVEKRSDLK